jgi:hypothetical protein
MEGLKYFLDALFFFIIHFSLLVLVKDRPGNGLPGENTTAFEKW